MARKRKRRHFGSSTWQMTERLFARSGGPAPRRRQVCKMELRALRSVVKRIGRGFPGSATGSIPDIADAWDHANHGACRKARKKIVKIVKSHPRTFNRINFFRKHGLLVSDLY